jgi:hypothetical protein
MLLIIRMLLTSEGVFNAIYSMDTTVSSGTVTICQGVAR